MEISYALGYDQKATRVVLVDLPNPCRIDVTDIAVDQIRTRVRLRTPDEDKIKELSESIKYLV